MYRNVIPFTPEILTTLVGHQVGTVGKALETFKSLDLIEVLDNGAIYMMDIQNFIGKSSTEADCQREYYNKIKNEKVSDNALRETIRAIQKLELQRLDIIWMRVIRNLELFWI